MLSRLLTTHLTMNREMESERPEKSPARKSRDLETPEERAAREERERQAHREWMERNKT
jgi:hypothetical protein